jgi:hypothetical protein
MVANCESELVPGRVATGEGIDFLRASPVELFVKDASGRVLAHDRKSLAGRVITKLEPVIYSCIPVQTAAHRAVFFLGKLGKLLVVAFAVYGALGHVHRNLEQPLESKALPETDVANRGSNRFGKLQPSNGQSLCNAEILFGMAGLVINGPAEVHESSRSPPR